MANRRTLGDAMTLSSDKLAFIQGTAGKPAAIVSPPANPEIAPVSVTPSQPEPQQPAAAEGSDAPTSSARTTTRRSRPRSRNEETDDSILLGMSRRWVPLTTKLAPSTAAALKRAGLEQRLRGATPATVQDIVEIAVSTWLADNDYL